MRWWCSWRGLEDDWRPVIWPLPSAWLGVWCSGYGDGYSTIVGWVEADSVEALEALVCEGWPEADGSVRYDIEVIEDCGNGERSCVRSRHTGHTLAHAAALALLEVHGG